jgi:hypothetical protein
MIFEVQNFQPREKQYKRSENLFSELYAAKEVNKTQADDCFSDFQKVSTFMRASVTDPKQWHFLLNFQI